MSIALIGLASAAILQPAFGWKCVIAPPGQKSVILEGRFSEVVETEAGSATATMIILRDGTSAMPPRANAYFDPVGATRGRFRYTVWGHNKSDMEFEFFMNYARGTVRAIKPVDFPQSTDKVLVDTIYTGFCSWSRVADAMQGMQK